jgi:hypothetical protein
LNQKEIKYGDSAPMLKQRCGGNEEIAALILTAAPPVFAAVFKPQSSSFSQIL